MNILDELVAELLTYAGFDREKPKLNFQCHSIAPWLKQQFADTLHIDDEVSCRVCGSEHDTSIRVWFDPKYLDRAVGNLVENAIRYAAGQMHLVLEYSGEACRIHVDDDGPGIPQADRKRIFEPFFRLDSSRSRVSGGYGLGLAIVQRIITWHDGSVAVSDSPLGGARFTIEWPGLIKR